MTLELLEAVRAHVRACPVSYKFDDDGNLMLWIPDDRPDRGLQVWLRELDVMLGLAQEAEHEAPDRTPRP